MLDIWEYDDWVHVTGSRYDFLVRFYGDSTLVRFYGSITVVWPYRGSKKDELQLHKPIASELGGKYGARPFPQRVLVEVNGQLDVSPKDLECYFSVRDLPRKAAIEGQVTVPLKQLLEIARKRNAEAIDVLEVRPYPPRVPIHGRSPFGQKPRPGRAYTTAGQKEWPSEET